MLLRQTFIQNHWSSPASSLLPGTAAPKTWPSLLQKPLPSTGSYPSMTSSRRTSVPSFAPWGFLPLPTPDWPADGRSPTPCVPGTSRQPQTTSPLEGPAKSSLVIVFGLIFKPLPTACECVFFVFTGSLNRTRHTVSAETNCPWCWSSFPWPVILSTRQSLSTKRTVCARKHCWKSWCLFRTLSCLICFIWEYFQVYFLQFTDKVKRFMMTPIHQKRLLMPAIKPLISMYPQHSITGAAQFCSCLTLLNII